MPHLATLVITFLPRGLCRCHSSISFRSFIFFCFVKKSRWRREIEWKKRRKKISKNEGSADTFCSNFSKCSSSKCCTTGNQKLDCRYWKEFPKQIYHGIALFLVTLNRPTFKSHKNVKLSLNYLKLHKDQWNLFQSTCRCS